MAKRGPKSKIDALLLRTTAATIVRDKGLQALSMSSLARELGTSVSALYRYFPSKEALWVSLQMQALSSYEHAAQDAFASVKVVDARTALIRLVHVCKAYTDTHKRDTFAFVVVSAFMGAPQATLRDDAAQDVNAKVLRVMSSAIAALESAQQFGAISPGDAHQRAYIVWAMLSGLDGFRKRDRLVPDSARVDALVCAGLATLIRGFGACDSLAEDVLGQRASLSV